MDYKKLGLKIGLEIHQQLNTSKLFCRCPSIIKEDKPDMTFERKLRAVVGETGVIDIAALHEVEKNKSFVYEYYNDCNCLVELDEEPPREINKEALNIALQIVMLLNAKPFKKLQVMRKTVIDGSNTSGFQRTALIARNGYIKLDNKKINIATICLEEDAARIIKKEKDKVFYRLDRLGIPLVEITTKPDIESPEEASKVAEKIGLLLRSTKVKRGLGTIRQDINISIKGGARTEIKGCQELNLLEKIIKTEILRQLNLIEIKEELLKRTKGKAIKIERNFIDITKLLEKSDSRLIQANLKKGNKALALKLPLFAGLIGREKVKGTRLGKEFSDYVKVKTGLQGILHSDELPAYGITQDEVDAIKGKLNCKHEDAFVIVLSRKEEAERALKIIAERAERCFSFIPEEVRQANADGTSSFLRPLPGSARMYPETDLASIDIDITNIKIPETIETKIERYVRQGIDKDMAKVIALEKPELFEELTSRFKEINPRFIADIIIGKLNELKRDYDLDINKIKEEHFITIFEYLTKKRITKQAIEKILIDICKDEFNIEKYFIISGEKLKEEVEKIINENKGLNPGKLKSIVMEKLKIKANPKEIIEIFNSLIN